MLLRPARPDDLMPLHAIFSDPQTMRYWSHPAHEELAPTQAFLEAFMRADPEARYEFILEFDGVCVGKAGDKDFLYGGTEWCDTAYYRLLRAAFQGAGERR
ncbi:GNAT family N-acetyltransferase [Sedimentitalea todarodis]|uniref:GNAT family N-acetyltransferase n=1 Tax=Sedimentitalea todarodis TaxID=1631240 RepID=A0ABU3VAT6_9RHOB|nr:GNAT family N-acetyltransferase [Sedimentitalea todarodis]MDU9003274.1 GNAT family N-acetyltransferase [Sedimentitalea todarodis]